jgi:hypothetical protein
MHTESAAAAKGHLRGRTLNVVPRDGTRIRAVYDLFYANKGKIIDFCTTNKKLAWCLTPLADTYGLDIRCIRKNKWCLVGEWFGRVYVDYLNDPTEKSQDASVRTGAASTGAAVDQGRLLQRLPSACSAGRRRRA